MMNTYLTKSQHLSTTSLASFGRWTVENVADIEKILHGLNPQKNLLWDISGIEDFDSAGVLLFAKYFKKFKAKVSVTLKGYTLKQAQMYRLLELDKISDKPKPKQRYFLEEIGKKVLVYLEELRAYLAFLGELFYTFIQALLHPRTLRMKEIVYHIHHSGFSALIIISLTSFLVGMVIAYQGSVQLAKFGADIFIVDTVAISITRELGPMITAIVIAGRSGSAYTAEIGAMKITEEISAMRTMGFDPFAFLVLPRVIALMIALPLLIFFSDIMGILGGMVASMLELGISFEQFSQRLYEVLEVKHYLLGMIKGPIFAFVIASLGCFRGLQVSNNTESIGLQTTSSVVNGIFLVIVFDAIFSVIYTKLGL